MFKLRQKLQPVDKWIVAVSQRLDQDPVFAGLQRVELLESQPSAPVCIERLIHSKLFPALHGLAAVVVEELEKLPKKVNGYFRLHK